MANPTALTYLYTSADEVSDLLSSEGVDIRLDDDADEFVDSSELLRLDPGIINYATSKVNLYLGERYAAADLATSWQVHEWCTVIAAVMLCRRRANPVPKTLAKEQREAIEEMREVRVGDLSLSDIGERESSQPSLSNMTMDRRYHARPLRKQKSLSTPRTTPIPSHIHYPTEYISAAEEGGIR